VIGNSIKVQKMVLERKISWVCFVKHDFFLLNNYKHLKAIKNQMIQRHYITYTPIINLVVMHLSYKAMIGNISKLASTLMFVCPEAYQLKLYKSYGS